MKQVTAREKVKELLTGVDTLPAKLYGIFMALLVIIVCFSFVVETYPIPDNLYRFLTRLDIAITFVFVIDYLLRFWVHNFSIRYLFTPIALIDLMSILPLFLGTHWQFVRVLRLFRILRLLHILRQGKERFWDISRFNLKVIQIFFSLFCIIFISAGLVYDVENRHNPEIFSTFFDAFYFVIVSLSTVGYGDIVPISGPGRVVTVMMIISGGILLPWQLTSLARYLIRGKDKYERACSKCGLDLHDNDARFCRVCGHSLPKKR